MKLVELPGNLIGGTLVEYKRGYGREMEFARGTVTRIGMEGEEFVILTDSDQSFMTLNISEDIVALGLIAIIEKIDDVYYIDTPMGWSYAVAPKGVKIPKKPVYSEPDTN